MDADLCPKDRTATLLIHAPRSDASLVQIGAIIGGRYEVEKIIGRGGFGAVFAARHVSTGQGVALKVLSSGEEDDDTALRRFFQEARVTSSLRHPNTIRVFDFGQDDTGLVYIAMELLNGRTLKQELKARLKEGRVFSEREALDIGIAVTRSLGEAHSAGLVHRDLKPDNIFLHHVDEEDPVVKVLDFGIVKLSGVPAVSLEASQTSGPGTPAYMSPEQAMNADVDGRSDLYSLGVMLFQIVAGEVPLRAENVVQTLYLQVNSPAPDVREKAKVPVSEGYAAIVRSALSKDPGERFPNARAMREALRLARDGLPALSPSQSGAIPGRFELALDQSVSSAELEALDTMSSTPAMLEAVPPAQVAARPFAAPPPAVSASLPRAAVTPGRARMSIMIVSLALALGAAGITWLALWHNERSAAETVIVHGAALPAELPPQVTAPAAGGGAGAVPGAAAPSSVAAPPVAAPPVADAPAPVVSPPVAEPPASEAAPAAVARPPAVKPAKVKARPSKPGKPATRKRDDILDEKI